MDEPITFWNGSESRSNLFSAFVNIAIKHICVRQRSSSSKRKHVLHCWDHFIVTEQFNHGLKSILKKCSPLKIGNSHRLVLVLEIKVLEWHEIFTQSQNKNTVSLCIPSRETKQTKQPITDCGAFQVVPKTKIKKREKNHLNNMLTRVFKPESVMNIKAFAWF